MSFFGNFFGLPSVRAEAAEDDELVDPMTVLKENCTPHCEKYKEKLETCTDRVNSKSQTTETCTEELIDFMHCVDHCVAKDLFAKLK